MQHIEVEGLAGGGTGRIDTQDCRATGEVLADVGAVVPGRRGEAVRFGALLERFEPLRGATHVTLESADGAWSASLTLADVTDGWLVFAEDGEPLDERAGGPFRLYLPEQSDACANVKHLARVTFSDGAGRDTRPPVDERNC